MVNPLRPLTNTGLVLHHIRAIDTDHRLASDISHVPFTALALGIITSGYLHERVLAAVYVVDFAKLPLDNFLPSAIPVFPKAHLLQADFLA